MCLAQLIMLTTQNKAVKSVQARPTESLKMLILISHSSVQHFTISFPQGETSLWAYQSVNLGILMCHWIAGMLSKQGAEPWCLLEKEWPNWRGRELTTPPQMLCTCSLPPSLVFRPASVNSDLFFYERGYLGRVGYCFHHRVAHRLPVK